MSWSYRSTITICMLVLTTLIGQSAASVGGGGRSFEEIEFSPWPVENVTWSSSTSFRARGMAPFYNFTNIVLRLFETEDQLPEGYIIVTHSHFQLGPKIDESDFSDLAKENWGILTVVAVCAVIIIFAPIVGLCFCCCRCAGACGGRSEPFDKKHDTCRRIFLGLLLICAGTGMIFGVVIAFMSNNYLQEGVDSLTTTTRSGVNDTSKYLKITTKEIDHLMVENYNELNSALSLMLDEAAANITEDLEQASKTVSITQLNEFVQTLPEIKRDLTTIGELTSNIKVNASDLNTALRKIKNELLQTLKDCTHQSCVDLKAKNDIGQLGTDIDYDKLPGVTDYIEDIDSQISSQLMNKMRTSQTKIDNLKRSVKDVIEESVRKVKEALNSSGVALGKASSNIQNQLKGYWDPVERDSEKVFGDADYYIKEYAIYRYYVGLAISSVLLLVLICVTFGLLCGICGKRPDGYGDDCCNKGAGSRFLMIGVAVIFLTISILTAAALIHFIAGLVAHRVTCVSLKDPENDSLFKYVDSFVDLNYWLPETAPWKRNRLQRVLKDTKSADLRLSQVIQSCHENKSAFEVLRLSERYDIDEIRNYPDQYNLDALLEELVQNLNVPVENFLDVETRREIERLANSNINAFDSSTFDQYLSDNITKVNLTDLAKKLKQAADNVLPKDTQSNLRSSAMQLKLLNDHVVQPMIYNTQEILRLAKKLDQAFKFNSPSFRDAILNFLKEADEAQAFIAAEGTTYVRVAVEGLTKEFKDKLESYMNNTIDKFKFEVGRCQPLSNVLNATLVATCDKIIDPWNTFWAGMAWCILLFFPTIILSAKLSSLYQKSDPYPGPLVESEYLYDAYSERDNIPLANAKNKRRKKNDRRRDHRDYYEDSSSSHGPPSSSRDARYTDMAPNTNNNRNRNQSTVPTISSPYNYPAGQVAVVPTAPEFNGDQNSNYNNHHGIYRISSTNPYNNNNNSSHSNDNPSYGVLKSAQKTLVPKPPSPTQYFDQQRFEPKSLKQGRSSNDRQGYY